MLIIGNKIRAFGKNLNDKYSNLKLPMNLHKLLPTLIVSIGLFTAADSAKAQLLVQNGNFQDVTGLTDQGGGWYSGVPAGWSSSTTSLTFNVINYSSGNLGANLQTLGPSTPTFTPLYQSVGLLPSTGDVSLSFNILGLSATYGMAAAIYDASSGTGPTDGWNLLVSGSYDQTVPTIQTLIAPNVAANTTVGIGFWQWAGSPGIDEVTVVPEPSTYALLVLAAGGLAAHVARRRRLR
jgi:hypothetical protein